MLRAYLKYIGSLILLFFTSQCFALAAPTLLAGRTVDKDMNGILLIGANYDSSTYVDIRSINGSSILASVLPPNITYLPETSVATPLGTQNGMLTFRINDPTLQNLLATQGLRFAVVSPNAGYQWAGLLTVNKSPVVNPAPFHSATFQPARGDTWASLADDTGASPTPREQTIKSINNELAAMHQSGFDTVTVFLNDPDDWDCVHGGGFPYDPLHQVAQGTQRAIAQEIFIKIADANHLKVIFDVAMSSYRRSTDGRSAWSGLADQYGNPSQGSWDFLHALTNPTLYYGTPSTTKLEVIGLTNSSVRPYWNDARIRGWILAPELSPYGMTVDTHVYTDKYFFDKYWDYFYSLVHGGGQFIGIYMLGDADDLSPPTLLAGIKRMKSWFAPSTGHSAPDMIGLEYYGSDPYPTQNMVADVNFMINALVDADTTAYPGDYSVPASKVFLAEGGMDDVTNPYSNFYFQSALQLVLRRSLGGINYFAADTMGDNGLQYPPSHKSYDLYNLSFSQTGTRVWTMLMAGQTGHSPTTDYNNPASYSNICSSPNTAAAPFGIVSVLGSTSKGVWESEALENFIGGNGMFSYAYPNPMIGNSSHLGSTSIFWDATEKPLVTSVEIHSGSPSGTLIGSGGVAGSVAVGNVSNGIVFYIQDVTNNKPRTAANTLSKVLASVQ